MFSCRRQTHKTQRRAGLRGGAVDDWLLWPASRAGTRCSPAAGTCTAISGADGVIDYQSLWWGEDCNETLPDAPYDVRHGASCLTSVLYSGYSLSNCIASNADATPFYSTNTLAAAHLCAGHATVHDYMMSQPWALSELSPKAPYDECTAAREHAILRLQSLQSPETLAYLLFAHTSTHCSPV